MLQFPFKLAQHIKDMEVITMPTWVIYTKRFYVRPRPKDLLIYAMYPKNAKSICTHVPSFQNTAEAMQFSRSRHFKICQPVPSSSCLFLPTTFCLALVMRSYVPSFSLFGVLLLLLQHFEVSSDTSILIVADPSIKASRTSSFEGAPFISRSGVDDMVWHKQAIKIVEIIVRSLLEDLLVARYWKRTFASLLIIIN